MNEINESHMNEINESHMNIIKVIENRVVGLMMAAFLKKIVRREPVIIKDIENSLLNGKTALITGGNSGIGYAIVKKIIESGARVVILARNPEKTKKAAEDLQCEYIIADMTDTEKLIDTVQQYIQDKHIDILVNSTGVLDKEPMLAKTPQGYDAVMNTNLKATYFMSQTIANHMLAKGIKGHIFEY